MCFNNHQIHNAHQIALCIFKGRKLDPRTQ